MIWPAKSTLQQITQAIKQAEDERTLNTQTIKRDTLSEAVVNEQIGHWNPKQLKPNSATIAYSNRPSRWHGPTIGYAHHRRVVTAAQPIMVIVPSEDKLKLKPSCPTSWHRLVQVGQDVVVKIESFPYTRYGYLTGKVKTVSFDAVEKAKDLKSSFTPPSCHWQHVEHWGQVPVLDKGMPPPKSRPANSVISYLLSPLQTKVDESLRER